MHLNLPDLAPFSSSKNILIAGMGGGFDLFCGLPLYFALKQRGISVHLASYSFTMLEYLKGGERLSPTLLGVTADISTRLPYAPELHLSSWFREERQEEVPIWCFSKIGAQPLISDYRLLVETLRIEGILLVDGGVDSLMRGDEAELGTPIEDSLSLLAVSRLPAELPRVLRA
jgi:hypothetical protein